MLPLPVVKDLKTLEDGVGEFEALTARNSDRAEDWSREDLARLEELTRIRVEAAGRIWGEALEFENWTSAHIKCS